MVQHSEHMMAKIGTRGVNIAFKWGIHFTICKTDTQIPDFTRETDIIKIFGVAEKVGAAGPATHG